MKVNKKTLKCIVLALIVFSVIKINAIITVTSLHSRVGWDRKLPGILFWILILISSAGILYLKKWARITILALSALWLGKGICEIINFAGGRVDTLPSLYPFAFIFLIVVPSFLLFFFSRSSVKQLFL